MMDIAYEVSVLANIASAHIERGHFVASFLGALRMMLEVSAKMQSARTPRLPTCSPRVGAALLKDGKMAGAVVFNNYHVLHKGSWCEISVAIDDAECVSRRGLRQIFEYPFKQLGVNRLQAVTSVENLRCREFIERLGFRLEGFGRKAHDGEQDAAVYSMLPGECKWI